MTENDGFIELCNAVNYYSYKLKTYIENWKLLKIHQKLVPHTCQIIMSGKLCDKIRDYKTEDFTFCILKKVANLNSILKNYATNLYL